MDWVAAKVYRPRMFRQLRNDKMYRQGRTVLKQSGKAVKATDTRAMRAMGKKINLWRNSWRTPHGSCMSTRPSNVFYNMGMAVPKSNCHHQ